MYFLLLFSSQYAITPPFQYRVLPPFLSITCSSDSFIFFLPTPSLSISIMFSQYLSQYLFLPSQSIQSGSTLSTHYSFCSNLSMILSLLFYLILHQILTLATFRDLLDLQNPTNSTFLVIILLRFSPIYVGPLVLHIVFPCISL